MASKLKISGVEPESIVDGKGFRYVVFTQGCPHHCPGCHNPQTHDFNGGKWVDIEDLFSEICENPLLNGVTFSGGEPFCQPRPLAELAKRVHEKKLSVTVFTGYLYEDLVNHHDPDVDALLAQTDVLIDGPFILAERDLTLAFRGSRNQRMINMSRTRETGQLVLEEE
ncbi:anaerobic ribonucleoside-triphosphate reductase activating protein [Caproiciproducens galactitolivorans]|uniref:Anaerobic ribonucleoside-triphosphate reductase-activating protein n=1 Tax=Caproiciproducens galactitolivorans TaxID=642589 RepID=A0A4Z0YC11_9FIRM|nr:anaerobic ribonucleoside-triphosphate reductase activating protein [Caproiciproducens galactitolivorans]QEY35317.1 anaerobic ribonucleoside-triphosphate reductase activating protein [Caproiciproducens galactitolivorans]TGJ77015.1 pyruvate formate-lyase 1-activating enzyme [Caproiciproducens galactitolivorans]